MKRPLLSLSLFFLLYAARQTTIGNCMYVLHLSTTSFDQRSYCPDAGYTESRVLQASPYGRGDLSALSGSAARSIDAGRMVYDV